MTFSRVVFSSKHYRWNTPDDAYKELDEEFHFTFDPAVPPRVGNFSGDGLREKWSGRVFCNPPYARKLTLRWILKGWRELVNGNCELIVFLIPMRNSDYFRFLRKVGAECRLNDGRLKFNDEDNGAPFDSAIFILNKETVTNYYANL